MNDRLRAVPYEPEEPEEPDGRPQPHRRPERRHRPDPARASTVDDARGARPTRGDGHPAFPRPWQRAIWLLILGGFAVAAFLRAFGVEF